MGSEVKPAGNVPDSDVEPPQLAKETISLGDADPSGENQHLGGARHTRTELSGSLGRYRILRRLGEGGMGTVYLAFDTQFDINVALKVPHFSAAYDDQIVQRFYREARSAIKLRHSNICPVYDVGQIGGQHYIAMAYIEGRSLATFVNAERPLPERQAARIVCKIALALQEAHQNGVVHRDLKPSNIMYDEKRKEPVVMDFGLATQVQQDASEPRLTQAGTLLGSPSYMSPEQVGTGNREVGPLSDLYSLSVILYELLTGRLPFEGTIGEVLGSIAILAPPPLSRFRPSIDPRIEEICTKGMAKKVEHRYASMRELAKALADFANAPIGFAANSAETPAKGVAVPREASETAPLRPDARTPRGGKPARPAPGTKREDVRPAANQVSQKALSWLPWAVVGGLCCIGGLLFLFGGRGGARPETGGTERSGEESPGGTQGASQSSPSNPGDRPPPQHGPDPRDWPMFQESGPDGRPPRRPGGPHGGPPGGPPGGPFHERDFRAADRNRDGELDPGEYPLHIIHRADTDGDDRLTRDEFEAGKKAFGEEFFAPPTEEDMRKFEPPGGGRRPPRPPPGG